MKQTVVGLFNKSSEAQEAVQQLVSKGFNNSDIDLSTGSISSDTETGSANLDLDKKDEHESGVSRFFKNLFGDDDNDANKYSTAATRGRSIVTVHAQSADEAEKAADILDNYGAIDVDENADDDYNNNTMGAAPVGMFNETAGASASSVETDMNTSTGTFDTANRTTSFDDNKNTSKTSIPIIEEEIQVGKRTVETGGKRLRSRIIETPVEEELRLREERVYVNRTPVNRTASDTDFDTFKEGEIELREHAEVPLVSKEARVVEEVSLGKEMNERSETVRDTVRKTEVDVEDITTNSSTSGTTTDNFRKDN